MPAAELCDRPATVEQIWGQPAVAELRDRLATADAPHEMLTLLEEELVRRLREIDGLDTRPPCEQRHRGDRRGGADQRPRRGSPRQQHVFGEAVQGGRRRHAEAAGSQLPLHRHRAGARRRRTDRLGRRCRWRGLLRPGPLRATSSGSSPGSRRPGTSKSGGDSCAIIPTTCWMAGRCRPIDFLQDRQLTTRQTWSQSQAEEEPMGKVVMNASVSVDGFIAARTTIPDPCSTG